MNLYDAHNHLQDERFGSRRDDLIQACRAQGVLRMVVNGSCPADWDEVAALAAAHPDLVIPSFGVHPWEAPRVAGAWRERLESLLRAWPNAGVGEIGLDRWKSDLSYSGQEEVFLAQLRLAAELNRPASIHGLRAWGRLLELLGDHDRPAKGFLLHSYGGPAELVPAFVRLGSYFSLPGAFLHPSATRKHAAFRAVPLDRILLETDAPDQLPPAELVLFPIADSSGRPINHPANLPRIHDAAARLLNLPVGVLADACERNFQSLFAL